MDDLDELKARISEVISREINVPQREIKEKLEVPKDRKYGDIAFPCFSLAKELKKNPSEIASDLAERLKGEISTNTATAFSIGPYLNIAINPGYKVKKVLERIIGEKEKYGSGGENEGMTLVIDFSHPNIAKPFGLGHLRSTVIGNALSNIYRFSGYKVVKLNYIGDWGKQFGLLDVAYNLWGKEEELEKDPIMHLYELYVKINRSIEEGNESLDEKGREAFRNLEQGKEENVSLWKRFRDLSIKEFKKVYSRLGIEFDSYDGEAFLNDRMKNTIKRLRENNLLKESEGALIIDLEDEGLGNAIIQKSNGSTTYLTRDIAAAEYRHNTYDFDTMLYVVGQPQELHFKQLFAILRKMGYTWIEKCHHVMFGYIKGMSTRKGTIVFLDDVLDEAGDRVKKKMKEIFVKKIKDSDIDRIAEDIGVSAVLFSDLKHRRIKDIDFDWDRLLKLQGDTGPYLQNALARIFGIFRKAQIGLPECNMVDYTLLDDEKAKALVDAMGIFPVKIRDTLRLNEPSIITGFLLSLAKIFHAGYNELKVKGAEEPVAQARLLLFECVKQVLINGFSLLGFRVLEEM